MKQQLRPKRLVLNRERIRQLESKRLGEIKGGLRDSGGSTDTDVTSHDEMCGPT